MEGRVKGNRERRKERRVKGRRERGKEEIDFEGI